MSNESRRKLLKSIAAGSGAIVAGKSLPESWSRPVVDAVMLPVHAMTSTTRVFATNNLQVGSIETNNNSMLAQWLQDGLDMLVPSASAQDFSGRACATVTGDNIDFWMQVTADFQQTEVLVAEGEAIFQNGDTGSFTGDDYYMAGEGCLDPAPFTGTIEVVELTDDYITLTSGEPGSEPFKILLASSCPEKLVCVDLPDS